VANAPTILPFTNIGTRLVKIVTPFRSCSLSKIALPAFKTSSNHIFGIDSSAFLPSGLAMPAIFMIYFSMAIESTALLFSQLEYTMIDGTNNVRMAAPPIFFTKE